MEHHYVPVHIVFRVRKDENNTCFKWIEKAQVKKEMSTSCWTNVESYISSGS